MMKLPSYCRCRPAFFAGFFMDFFAACLSVVFLATFFAGAFLTVFLVTAFFVAGAFEDLEASPSLPAAALQH